MGGIFQVINEPTAVVSANVIFECSYCVIFQLCSALFSNSINEFFSNTNKSTKVTWKTQAPQNSFYCCGCIFSFVYNCQKAFFVFMLQKSWVFMDRPPLFTGFLSRLYQLFSFMLQHQLHVFFFTPNANDTPSFNLHASTVCRKSLSDIK